MGRGTHVKSLRNDQVPALTAGSGAGSALADDNTWEWTT
jgi:hypothetical protein